MKKLAFICIIIFICSGNHLFSQSINMPADSISALLCYKWEIDYAWVEGTKIGRTPGASDINFEFNKDKTFSTTITGVKEKKTGIWAYDPNKKLINLILNGSNTWSVISLKEGELIILPKGKAGTPEAQMDIKIVYKIKSN